MYTETHIQITYTKMISHKSSSLTSVPQLNRHQSMHVKQHTVLYSIQQTIPANATRQTPPFICMTLNYSTNPASMVSRLSSNPVYQLLRVQAKTEQHN
jgi:hypothetical protein